MGSSIRPFDFVTVVTVLLCLSSVGAFFEDFDESPHVSLRRVKRVINGKSSEPGKHPFIGNLQVNIAKRYCPLLKPLDPMDYLYDCFNVTTLEITPGCLDSKKQAFNIYKDICIEDIKLETNDTTEYCDNADAETKTKFDKLKAQCLEDHLPLLKNKTECFDLRDDLADYLEACAAPGEARAKPLSTTWTPLCGASLLTPSGWLLTAAHCFRNLKSIPIDNWRVVLGESFLDDVKEGSENTYELKNLTLHEDYENYFNGTKQNDIALIQLKEPVTLSPMVQVVHLAEAADDVEGEVCTLMGWGQTSTDPANPANARALQEAQARRANFSECRAWAAERGASLTARDTCTLPVAGGPRTSMCSGDSGGPLVCGSGDRVVQVGVGSSSESDEDLGDCIGDYTIYKKVSAYREWVEGHVCPNNTSCLPRAPAKQTDTHGGDFVSDQGQTQHEAGLSALLLIAAFTMNYLQRYL